jgi:hypothetical protein
MGGLQLRAVVPDVGTDLQVRQRRELDHGIQAAVERRGPAVREPGRRLRHDRLPRRRLGVKGGRHFPQVRQNDLEPAAHRGLTSAEVP